jgi:hypothetical protein
VLVVDHALTYLDERGLATRTTTSTSVAEGYRRFRAGASSGEVGP